MPLNYLKYGIKSLLFSPFALVLKGKLTIISYSFIIQCFIILNSNSLSELLPIKPQCQSSCNLTLLKASLVIRGVTKADPIALICLGILLYYSLLAKNLPWTMLPQKCWDLENLVNAFSCGIAIKDIETGKIEFYNGSLYNLLKVKEQTQIKSKIDLIQEKVEEKVQESLNLNNPKLELANSRCDFCIQINLDIDEEQKQNINTEVTDKSISGVNAKTLEIRGKKLRWEGKAAMLYAITDMSQSNNNDSKESLNVVKSRLRHSISHELRTPINGILGSLDHILQILSNPDPQISTNLNIAISSTHLLLNKYSNILVSFPINNTGFSSNRNKGFYPRAFPV